MEKIKVTYEEVSGTHGEIGRQLAKRAGSGSLSVPPPTYYSKQDGMEALRMYDRYCPGINEEVGGFAEEAGIAAEQIAYSWMTYLIPRCSGLILTGKKMCDGHARIVRNYEYGIEEEDRKLSRTAVKGKYVHLGGTIAEFGRTEGINEKGLAVSMSSCGIPVGNLPGMRAPKQPGLQFWAVIRSLLENCGDVEEALSMVRDMPIAYNINLYLADEHNGAVLFETMDGKCAYERIAPEDEAQFLCGTNHIVIRDLQPCEPFAMKNSAVRYRNLTAFASGSKLLEETQLREFMLKKYPVGMTAHYYKEWFGTIKTVVLDTVEKRYSICWFGLPENGWQDYYVQKEPGGQTEVKTVICEEAVPGFFSTEKLC